MTRRIRKLSKSIGQEDIKHSLSNSKKRTHEMIVVFSKSVKLSSLLNLTDSSYYTVFRVLLWGISFVGLFLRQRFIIGTDSSSFSDSVSTGKTGGIGSGKQISCFKNTKIPICKTSEVRTQEPRTDDISRKHSASKRTPHFVQVLQRYPRTPLSRPRPYLLYGQFLPWHIT